MRLLDRHVSCSNYWNGVFYLSDSRRLLARLHVHNVKYSATLTEHVASIAGKLQESRDFRPARLSSGLAHRHLRVYILIILHLAELERNRSNLCHSNLVHIKAVHWDHLSNGNTPDSLATKSLTLPGSAKLSDRVLGTSKIWVQATGLTRAVGHRATTLVLGLEPQTVLPTASQWVRVMGRVRPNLNIFSGV